MLWGAAAALSGTASATSQCHQLSVQGGVSLLYLHSSAFKYRYILYIPVGCGTLL
jgi:hypothetical protein